MRHYVRLGAVAVLLGLVGGCAGTNDPGVSIPVVVRARHVQDHEGERIVVDVKNRSAGPVYVAAKARPRPGEPQLPFCYYDPQGRVIYFYGLSRPPPEALVEGGATYLLFERLDAGRSVRRTIVLSPVILARSGSGDAAEHFVGREMAVRAEVTRVLVAVAYFEPPAIQRWVEDRVSAEGAGEPEDVLVRATWLVEHALLSQRERAQAALRSIAAEDQVVSRPYAAECQSLAIDEVEIGRRSMIAWLESGVRRALLDGGRDQTGKEPRAALH